MSDESLTPLQRAARDVLSAIDCGALRNVDCVSAVDRAVTDLRQAAAEPPPPPVAPIDDSTRLQLLSATLRHGGHLPGWFVIGVSQVQVGCATCRKTFHVGRAHATDSPATLNLETKTPNPLHPCRPEPRPEPPRTIPIVRPGER